MVSVCVSLPGNIIRGKQAASNIETCLFLSRPTSYRWFPVGGLRHRGLAPYSLLPVLGCVTLGKSPPCLERTHFISQTGGLTPALQVPEVFRL